MHAILYYPCPKSADHEKGLLWWHSLERLDAADYKGGSPEVSDLPLLFLFPRNTLIDSTVSHGTS